MKLTLLEPKRDFDQIKAIWHDLSQHANVSYYLSWGWVENWLSFLPENADVHLAVISEDELPVLAFFIGVASILRHGAVHSRTLFLNATGIPAIDLLYIEYNAMLHSGKRAIQLHEILELLPNNWDEFSMPGLDANAFPGNMLNQATRFGEIQIEKDVPSPYVDLETVRQNDGDYVALLSSKTRRHVRRSHRGYEEVHGPVTLVAAHDAHSALEIFNEMVTLHQKTWQARGEHGVFASELFLHFHLQLIQKRFDYGEIQLLRIKAGDSTIGCLYNFVYNGKVYGYQAGLHYGEDPHLTPGYTSLVEAVIYNAKIGNAYFDFLGSDAVYKGKLSTHEQRIIWAKMQKPRLQFRIETGLKTLKQGFLSLHSEKAANAKKA